MMPIENLTLVYNCDEMFSSYIMNGFNISKTIDIIMFELFYMFFWVQFI